MQGSMRQRGDAWQVRVFAGRDLVTGKKRWISKTVHGELPSLRLGSRVVVPRRALERSIDDEAPPAA